MGFCVCIDAGHGSQTIGAVSPHNGAKEYVVAWNISKHLSYLLVNNGYSIVNTKEHIWENPTLMQRVKIANDSQCDMFITIHLNAAAEYNPNPRGCETWIYNKAKEPTQLLARSVQCAMVNILKCKDRGVRTSSEFTTLKRTKMPAICVEPAFMTNVAESKRMTTEEWTNMVARAIFSGIVSWFSGMEGKSDAQRSE